MKQFFLLTKSKKSIIGIIILILLFSTVACNSEKSPLDPKNPVTIKVWNYYNGYQKISFDQLVTEFNNTVGQKKGILVEAYTQGSIEGVVQELLNASENKTGSQPMPDLVSLYAETAYELDQKGLLVNLDDYFTNQELNEFIPSFIEEGRLESESPLKIFPVFKSTEVMAYNKTDWEKFQKSTGAAIENIHTMEQLVDTAEQYYLWTDGLTPYISEDGKALFGRDSLSNYMMVGSRQLGHEIFTVENGNISIDLDKETMRVLWKNYYLPFINGYFGAYGRYRSDDAKTGDLIVIGCATSAMGYFPDKVILENGSYPIECDVLPLPLFEGAEKQAVQQGAGYCVIHSDEKKEYATVQFLKWLTSDEYNTRFAVGSGYLPVRKSSLTEEKINGVFSAETENSLLNENVRLALITGLDLFQNYKLETSKPFDGATTARIALENSMQEISQQGRQTVLQRISQGMTRQEATADLSTDASFEAWYDSLQTQVYAAIPQLKE